MTVDVNFPIDADLKKKMEKICSDAGLSIEQAVTIFIKETLRLKRFPFEVTVDPFYSDSNMAHLRRGIAALNAGKGAEHEIVEATGE